MTVMTDTSAGQSMQSSAISHLFLEAKQTDELTRPPRNKKAQVGEGAADDASEDTVRPQDKRSAAEHVISDCCVARVAQPGGCSGGNE